MALANAPRPPLPIAGGVEALRAEAPEVGGGGGARDGTGVGSCGGRVEIMTTAVGAGEAGGTTSWVTRNRATCEEKERNGKSTREVGYVTMVLTMRTIGQRVRGGVPQRP